MNRENPIIGSFEVEESNTLKQHTPHPDDDDDDDNNNNLIKTPGPNSDKEGTSSADRVEKETSTSDKPRYRDLIFNSAAYKWMAAALPKKRAMTPYGGEDVCSNIHKEIETFLSRRTAIISKHDPSKRHAMDFTVDWNLGLYLREQFPRKSNMRVLLRHSLTLTGSLTNAQALPCGEYLRRTWPKTGPATLEVIGDALFSGAEATVKLGGESIVKCSFDQSQLHVKVEGTADFIATIAEQIAWLGATLRFSCSDSRIGTCRPLIRISGPAGASQLPSCHIEFSVKVDDEGAGQAWHGLFGNPVVAEGYPIPARAKYGTGLEIPVNGMTALTRCPRINDYMGYHVLKGFSFALVATEKTEDGILWQFYYSEDGSRLPYPNMGSAEKPSISHGDLERMRHIIG